MKHAFFGLGLGILLLSLASTAIAQSDACQRGFVWREANATDHVCVTPSERAEVAADNAASSKFSRPGSVACSSGYVWRMANASDHVCVTPQVRAQALSDNALAASRLAPATTGASTVGASDLKPAKLLAMPKPPSSPGCYRAPINTDRVEWRQVPCLSPQELAQLPHMASAIPDGALAAPAEQQDHAGNTGIDDQRECAVRRHRDG